MLFSKRDIFKIIWPLMLQQFLAIMVGMIDSMMVSSAGDAAVSGVSLVSTLDLVIIYTFVALATGGAVVISQAIGRKDRAFACNAAKQLFYATTAVATVVTIIVNTLRVPLLNILFGDTDPAVMESALDYFFYVSLSFPFLAMYESIAAAFRATGNSMVSLKVSLVINIVNVIGNAAFIFGFHMGAAGAAISTLVSRIVGVVIMIILIHNKNNAVYITKIFKYKPDMKIVGKMLRIGIPSGVENSIFQLGKLMTLSLISTFPTHMIAANAVAASVCNIQYVPGQALNSASVAIVGKCIGAGEIKQAKRYSRILLLTCYVSLFLVVLFMSVFSKSIIGLYDVSAESMSLARELMLFHGIVAIFIWPLAFLLPPVFRAASDVRTTLVVSIFSMWTFRVLLGYILAPEVVNLFGFISFKGAGFGIFGIWLAMIVDWIFRTVIYTVRYIRGTWLKKHSLT